MNTDRIDHILDQWHQESPELDTSSLAIVGRVLRIARLLEHHREIVLADFGLNVCSFDVLATLRRQGPPYQLKPTDLYSMLMLSSGAMTNRIDRLEQDEIVTRVRNVSDRRSVMVQLTPKGIALAEAVMPALFQKEKQLLAQLTEDESEQFIYLLRRFLLILDEA